MAAPDQEVINVSVQERLEVMTDTYTHYIQDHDARLRALEANIQRIVSSEANNQRTVDGCTALFAASRSDQEKLAKSQTKLTISSTSREDLANVLKRLCDRDDSTYQLITGELLKCAVAASASASASTSVSVAAPMPKRKLPAHPRSYEKCRNCNVTYCENEGPWKECCYHPGRKKVNHKSDFWENHDEAWNGNTEASVDYEDYEDYEEGFVWSCCGQCVGEQRGCEVTNHQPSPNFAKRART